MKKSTKKRAKRPTARKSTRRRKPAEITIRRSSGRKEKFDRDRMASTTSRSGVPFLMARDIAKKVTRRVRTESRGQKKRTITAGKIRKIIGQELHNRNPSVASSYGVGNQRKVLTNKKVVWPKPTIGSADTDQHGAYRGDKDSVMHDKSKRRTSAR